MAYKSPYERKFGKKHFNNPTEVLKRNPNTTGPSLDEVEANNNSGGDKPTFSDKGKAVTSGLASILGTALKARERSKQKGDTPDPVQQGGKQDDSYSSVVTYETNQTTRLRDDKKKKKDEY